MGKMKLKQVINNTRKCNIILDFLNTGLNILVEQVVCTERIEAHFFIQNCNLQRK